MFWAYLATLVDLASASHLWWLGKVTGFSFLQLLQLLNTQWVPTTNKSPQSSAICKQCIRLLQLFWKHCCLPNHNKEHVARLHYLWMMLWLLPGMSCVQWFELCCKPSLEDLCSLMTYVSTLLFLCIGMPFSHIESNWSTMQCFTLTESMSILTTRLVKKSSSMTKCLKANQSKKDPLTFSVFTLIELWQFFWDSALQNMFMIATYWPIGSQYLCSLLWN